ncbi:MAG: hypothetical protein M1838_001054 [Thelocarpon superellum]|nr:MAG: hypothetical protein M1838_001054 [Thelocarpon superellum]
MPPVWPGPIHHYTDVDRASIVNIHGTHRIHLGALIVRCQACLAPPSDVFRYGSAYAVAYRTMQAQADDICASMPYHCGLQLGKDDVAVDPVVHAPGAYLLLMPLFVCVLVESVPPDQHWWISGRLRSLRKIFGIDRAVALASLQYPGIISDYA